MFYTNILTLNLLTVSELYFCHVLKFSILILSQKRLKFTRPETSGDEILIFNL